MYLASLELNNVRAIRQMTLDFRKPEDPQGVRRWTVLLGENGCGKSTVLKSIGLLLAGSEALPDLLGSPDQWIHIAARQADLKATIRTAEGQERIITLTLRRGEGRDSVIKRNAKGLSQLDAAIRHADRNYFVAGYGAFRRPPDPNQRTSQSGRGRAPQLATLFSAAQDLVNLEQWAMDVDYQTSGSGRGIISDSLARLLPGMTFKDIDKSSRAVIMNTIDGEVPLRQLSEGYQSMAAWAGDLLFRMTENFKDRTNPLQARGVLLLDEMDLHLHPVWKRNLVEFLDSAFPNLQIVSTTHSPLSVQQCREGELYVVKREDSRPTLYPFNGDPSKLRLSDLFLSPLIGLDTLDSPRVASLREQARTIELKPGMKSGEDLKSLKILEKELEGTSPLPVQEAPGLERLILLQKNQPPISPTLLIAENEKLFNSTKKIKTNAGARQVSKSRIAAQPKVAGGRGVTKKTVSASALKGTKAMVSTGATSKAPPAKRGSQKVATKASAKPAPARKLKYR